MSAISLNKILTFTVLSVLIGCKGCSISVPYEIHEVQFIRVDYDKDCIVMKDLNLDSTVYLRYSKDLFVMEYHELCLLKGNPIFVFHYCNGVYYKV